jgi:hypothetical protein
MAIGDWRIRGPAHLDRLIRVDAVAEIWLIAVDLGVSSSRMPGGRVKRGRAITTGRRAADERYTTIA